MKYILSTDTVNHLIQCIEKKNTGSYLRFGDGDFYLMEGKYDMLSRPSKELQESYETLFKNHLTSSDMISIPFFCKYLNNLEVGMCPGNHEFEDHKVIEYIQKVKQYIPGIDTLYSHPAIQYIFVQYPELYVKFLQTIIKNNSTIVLATKEFPQEKIQYYFGNHIFIGGSSSNSFYERERIWEEFDKALDQVHDFTVCIQGLGCGGRAMSYKFLEQIQKKNKKVLLIDIGSSIDVLMGYRDKRAWVELTNPDMKHIDYLMEQYKK